MKKRPPHGVEKMLRLRDHTWSLDRTREGMPTLPPGLSSFLNHVRDEFLHYWQKAKRPSSDSANQVYPEIWVGNQESAKDEKLLKKLGIESILNMAIEVDYEPPENVFVAKVGIEDGVVAPPGAFDRAAKEIGLARKQGRKLLVHCAAGISRSSSAVLSYLMTHKDIGFEKGLRILRSSRPQINPHPHLVLSMMRDFGSEFKK